MAEEKGLRRERITSFSVAQFFTFVRALITDERTDKQGYCEYIQMNYRGRIVFVLPITTDGHVVLCKVHRIPAEAWVIDACGGRLDIVGDDEPTIAQEVLREQLGYEARGFEQVFAGPYDSNLTNAEMTCFIAHGAEKVSEPKVEDFEIIEPVMVPIAELGYLLLHQPEGIKVDIKLFALTYFLTRSSV
jgi:ADP-ribose pyrophosphatase